MGFYILQPSENRFGKHWAYGMPSKGAVYGEAPRCPICGNFVGVKKWLPPHEIEIVQADPNRLGDFLWGSFYPFLISERLHQIIREERIQGFDQVYEPATVTKSRGRKKANLLLTDPTYRAVEIHWNGANVDDEASGIVRVDVKCTYDRGSCVRYDRILLDETTWDGSDIFNPRGLPGRILVSERMKQIITAYSITNVLCIPSTDVTYIDPRYAS